MNANRIKKAIHNIYLIEHLDKNRVITYENKFITFNKLKVNTSRLLTRFSDTNWKQFSKFITSSIKPYDKYLDGVVHIDKDLLTFKTDNKFEYNVKLEMRLNMSNMNKYDISYRDLVMINNLIKEFGKIKSVSFYKYSKTMVKLIFNKYEIYLII